MTEKNSKSQKLVKYIKQEEIEALLSKKPYELDFTDITTILSILEKEYPSVFVMVKAFIQSRLRYAMMGMIE
jgi:hypothetical protein